MPPDAKITLNLSHAFRYASISGRFNGSRKSDFRAVRICPTGIEWIRGESGIGPITAFVPTENTLLLAVDLPAQRRRDRLTALPWAVEDLLIEPVSSLHLSLGPEISPRRYLVAAVRHSVMREWREMLASTGISHSSIVPDALALPVAPEGCWSVAVDDHRIIVRGEDATAFAIETGLFALAWESAGCPAIRLHGSGDLPEILPSTFANAQLTIADDRSLSNLLAESAASQPLNLAQGIYAPEADALLTALRRSAVVFGAGLLAYTAVLAADTASISHLANRRTAEAARLHAEIVPADRRSGDIATDIMGLSRMATMPHSAFLPLMGKASEALKQFSNEASLRSLVFSSDEGSLTFGVQVRDFAALQKVEAALTRAGIAIETGPAATAAGGVEAKIKLLAGAQ